MDTVTPEAARLLRKVAKHIQSEPRRFLMDDVIQRGGPGQPVRLDGIDATFAKCGTAACIAGWTCLLSGDEHVTMSNAERILGINPAQGNKLFLLEWWPDKFRDKYQDAARVSTRVRIAARRLEYFIRTGE